MIAPYWSKDHNGVVIPLLNKVLDAKNLSEEPQNWSKNKELAEQTGKELMTKEDFHVLYWQRNEINAILAEHEGDLLEGWFASSSEFNDANYWVVNFGDGYGTITLKYYSEIARGLIAL